MRAENPSFSHRAGIHFQLKPATTTKAKAKAKATTTDKWQKAKGAAFFQCCHKMDYYVNYCHVTYRHHAGRFRATHNCLGDNMPGDSHGNATLPSAAATAAALKLHSTAN